MDSVEIKREKGFLHVKISAVPLDPRYARKTLGSAKDVSFSVMGEEAVDDLLEKVNKLLSMVDRISSDVDKTLEALRG